MHETQPKDESKNIEIDWFDKGNVNLISKEDDTTQLLCEYKVKYKHKEDNKEDKIEEIKIEIKTPSNKNCNQLNDFEVFIDGYGKKLLWSNESSENNKNDIWQYLMYLNNEVNQFNNTKENTKFRDALCIMIFYYAVHERPFLSNNEFVKNMKKDDFKQYQEIIENTIKLKLRETGNNGLGQGLSGADNDERKKNILIGNREMTGDGTDVCWCLGNIWRKFCGCCIKEKRNNNTKIDKDFINNDKKINIS